MLCERRDERMLQRMIKRPVETMWSLGDQDEGFLELGAQFGTEGHFGGPFSGLGLSGVESDLSSSLSKPVCSNSRWRARVKNNGGRELAVQSVVSSVCAGTRSCS